MKVFARIVRIIIGIIIGSIILGMLAGIYNGYYNQNDTTKIDDSQTYIDRGRRMDGKGLHFEAISNYDMAIKLNPNNADAYYYRGIAKHNLGQYDAAIVDYNNQWC